MCKQKTAYEMRISACSSDVCSSVLPRHAGVLRLAAEKAGWDKPAPAGRARGIAVHESFNSFVAEVAEVSVADDGTVKVEKVVCAVDCGVAVTPDQVKAQMEGGIGYGLGAVLHNDVTLTDGRVDQSNFPDSLPLRINEMQQIDATRRESRRGKVWKN